MDEETYCPQSAIAVVGAESIKPQTGSITRLFSMERLLKLTTLTQKNRVIFTPFLNRIETVAFGNLLIWAERSQIAWRRANRNRPKSSEDYPRVNRQTSELT